MAKIYILIALLPQLFYTLVHGQESPCPQYFTYIVKPGTDETIGQIEIQSPPRTGKLHLKSSNGQLELARSVEESAEAVRQGKNLLYHLYFPLRHPIPKIIGIWFNGERCCSGPDVMGHFVTTITLEHTLFLSNALSQNDQPSGSLYQNWRPTPMHQWSIPNRPTAISQDIDRSQEINFSHESNKFFQNTSDRQSLPDHFFEIPIPPNQNAKLTLRLVSSPISKLNSRPISMPNLRPISMPNPRPISMPNPRPISMPNPRPISISNPRPISKPTSAKPAPQDDDDDSINNNRECGINSFTDGPNLLIFNGNDIPPGRWPWLVALFVTKEVEYSCAGSVLTNKHVITAAHCVISSPIGDNITYRDSNLLLVSLGIFKLTELHERGNMERDVANFTVHPDYTHKNSSDSDLAILILKTPVEYSSFIQPICLWTGSNNLKDIINKRGYVVGWGSDELGNRFTVKPKMVSVPIVSQEDCLWSHEFFIALTSKRTFCAGSRDQSGPCNGDSGSGLMIFDDTTKRYYLRGVVSRSIRNDQGTCDLTQYIIYVDVAQYIPWIQKQISIT